MLQIFNQEEQVKRVGRRRPKIKLFIERPGILVLCVNDQRADSCNLGCLKCAQHSVAYQATAHALRLPAKIDAEASQKHDGDRMPCEPFAQAFGCTRKFNASHRKAVKTDNRVFFDAHVSLGSMCCLIGQCVTL